MNGDTLAFLLQDRERVHFQPSDLVFIDTETTGLAGGSGTYAFLLGLGYLDDNEISIKQFFMPDFDSEKAMLSDLLTEITKFKVLVSYNGKSYDLPLLRNRLVMNRLENPLNSLAHIDLLHPARRLWKNVYPDLSLQGLEQALLNFRRADDIAGHLIPGCYFDFLQTHRAVGIKKIFQHNAMDIMSLIAFMIIFHRIISSPHLCDIRFDRMGLLKGFLTICWYERLLQTAALLVSGEKNQTDFDILFLKAMVHKKHAQFDEALKTWQVLIKEYPHFEPEVYKELGKYYEHKAREYDSADRIIDRAIKRIELSHALKNDNRHALALKDFAYRRQRIRRKIENGSRSCR